MQWRDGIASRVDRLYQVQFRRQNLRRGKSTLGFDQVRRTLHRCFQRRQIHFAEALRQGRVQQFMFRHDRFALEDMGDGVIQGLIFQSGDARLTSALD
jgi:hypothetical protein